MFKKHKRKSYLVVANFHRKFIDVNRRVNGSKACCEIMWPKCQAIADYKYSKKGVADLRFASKVNLARDIYDSYHAHIMDSINEIHKKFPGSPIYIIDVHAQKPNSDERLRISAKNMMDSVVVGTQDGRVVKSREEMYSKRGLLGYLTNRVKIYSPSNSIPDHPKYNRGHLVAEYGFNNTIGADINALQFEFGFNLRMKSKSRAKKAVLIDALIALIEI